MPTREELQHRLASINEQKAALEDMLGEDVSTGVDTPPEGGQAPVTPLLAAAKDTESGDGELVGLDGQTQLRYVRFPGEGDDVRVAQGRIVVRADGTLAFAEVTRAENEGG